MSKRGINKAILVGNIGNININNTPSGATVTSISLATSESWTDKNGAKKTETEWHKVVMFGKLAQIGADYLTEGMKIYIEGKIKTKKWQDKSGADRYTTEIIANEMQIMSDGGHKNDNSVVRQHTPAQNLPQNQRTSNRTPHPTPTNTPGDQMPQHPGIPDFDDMSEFEDKF